MWVWESAQLALGRSGGWDNALEASGVQVEMRRRESEREVGAGYGASWAFAEAIRVLS